MYIELNNLSTVTRRSIAMTPFESTDLKIIAWDEDNGTQRRFYILLDKKKSGSFDPYELLENMHQIEHNLSGENEKDQAFDDLMESGGIIEIFEDEEIHELIEENEIDPEDLHQSLYDLVAEESEKGTN